MKILLSFIIIIFLLCNYQLLPQSNYNKIGGVCFRFDDYHDPATCVIPYINIFNARGLKCTHAVNFGIYNTTPAYLSTVLQMQAQGFEIADHTPDHATRFFDIPLSDIPIYQGLNGVDHIITNVDDAKICLEWVSVKTNTYTGEGLINISGNTVTSVTPNEFTTMELPHTSDAYSMDAIYIPSINKLFKFDPESVSGSQITGLKSFWDEDNVNLTLNNVQYHKVGLNDVFPSLDAIILLSVRTQQYCDEHGITRPTIWIQPGGYHPQFYRADIKAALEPMGYFASGNFADPIPKLYNSYDPNDDNRYGMDWENFNEEWQSLPQVKKIIADNFARHHLSINQSHLSPESGTFAAYLTKTASILDWCLEKGIPIKTYTEWAQLLYKTPQNPYVNVFPSVDVDLDGNGNYPDGFNSLSTVTPDGVPGVFTKSFSKSGNHLVCDLYDLGGVERGENYFGIWIKGIGNIEVYLNIGDPNDPDKWQSNIFTSTSTSWVKYNCTFQISDTASNITVVEIYSANTSGPIKIGGFELRKNSSNQVVKVLLQGPYNGLVMDTSLNSQRLIPLSQPFNSITWNYSGAESVSLIPSDIVDWLLLDLRTGVETSSIVGRRAAFLKRDGSIVDLDGNSAISFIGVPNGSYFLGIHHRNHLSIVSPSPLSFSNGNTTTDYDFTTGQNQAYGTNPMKDLGGGYGMIAGDANGDGTINATDLNNYWIPQNGTQYNYQTTTSDFNLDGTVNATDLNIFWIPNNGNSTQVP